MSESAEMMIRQALHLDTAAIVDLYSELSKETLFLSDDVNETKLGKRMYQMADQIDQYYQHPTSLMLIAEIEEEIVGLGTLATLPGSRQRHVAEIGVGVRKGYWSNGIGTMLLEELLHFAQGTSLKVITLEVVQDNTRAISLYEKFGFNIVGSLSKRLFANDRYYDTYIMEYLIQK